MNDLIKRFSTLFENNLKELRTINEFIYENPELGHKEFKACATLTESLKNHGFEVTTNYCNMPTAFLGRYRSGNGGPVVAILAEYDALPGIGHGCGHNSFAVTSLGSAIILKDVMKESEVDGELLIIGTPAEETSGAKVQMAKEGVFKNVDIAMAVHATGEMHKRSGHSQAMEALQFTFIGKTAHAAGNPYDGINALDSVIILFNSINALRQQIRETARIHGIITKGGEAANIIPDLAVANFYVRANSLEYLKELVKKVKSCAKGAAIATGAQLLIENYETSFADLVTNKTLSKLYEKNLRALGVDEICDSKPSGSTDMGDVSHCCPTIHPYFPLCKRYLIGHSTELAQATIQPEAYKGIKEAAIAMALTAMDIFNNSSLLHEIKKEFNSRK
ncbi:M20 family metallopeptidase [Fusobacterium sp.]|uniref:M20 family metallopeptidase n=1 Tax=Fusobacterium sp. TaxID=68766 RepID=UPI00396C79A8